MCVTVYCFTGEVCERSLINEKFTIIVYICLHAVVFSTIFELSNLRNMLHVC
ncbi:hypothetical protein DSUL_60323 [Desulfovibrionales bacterium]